MTRLLTAPDTLIQRRGGSVWAVTTGEPRALDALFEHIDTCHTDVDRSRRGHAVRVRVTRADGSVVQRRALLVPTTLINLATRALRPAAPLQSWCAAP